MSNVIKMIDFLEARENARIQDIFGSELYTSLREDMLLNSYIVVSPDSEEVCLSTSFTETLAEELENIDPTHEK